MKNIFVVFFLQVLILGPMKKLLSATYKKKKETQTNFGTSPLQGIHLVDLGFA